MVLTLSNTIRVVAEISLVTLIPAKLKKAIDTTVPNRSTEFIRNAKFHKKY